MNLLRKKSIEKVCEEVARGEGDGDTPTLKRNLNAFDLILLGIGVVIGAGIFSLTGKVASENAGPGVIFSYMISGFACALAGLCYAEFASMVPASGSAYTYSYVTLGEIFAWVIGWDLVLEYAVGAGTVAVSWSAYLNKGLHAIGYDLPHVLAHGPFEKEVATRGLFNLPAALIVLAMSLLLAKGTKESKFFNTLMVGLKLFVIFSIIAIGWAYMNPANHVPVVPENLGEFGKFGWSGVLRGSALVFFAYIGFDAVSTASQEAKNPQRDVPIGILGSLTICTAIYIAFSWVLTGLAKYDSFDHSEKLAPVISALKAIPNHPWLNVLIIPAILAGFSSVIMILLMGQSRVFMAMARDGLLPKVFQEIHEKNRTPLKSNLIVGGVTALAVGILPDHWFGESCSIGTLLAFVLVCVSVVILRKTHPDVPRAFRCPGAPFVPILGAVVCLVMMCSMDGHSWARLVVWMVVGFVLYFGYGRHRSKLNGGE